MTEAERLQKIVLAQEKEIKRLRKLLAVVRTVSITVQTGTEEDPQLSVYLLGVGVDEAGFIEQAQEQIENLISQLANAKAKCNGATDSVTGEKLHGVSGEDIP